MSNEFPKSVQYFCIFTIEFQNKLYRKEKINV